MFAHWTKKLKEKKAFSVDSGKKYCKSSIILPGKKLNTNNTLKKIPLFQKKKMLTNTN
jgi:hypothetical protein